MKSVFTIMAILVSSSVFATTYVGTDMNQRPCSITVENVDLQNNTLDATATVALGSSTITEDFAMRIGTVYNANDTLNRDFTNISGSNTDVNGVVYTRSDLSYNMKDRQFTFKKSVTVYDYEHAPVSNTCFLQK